MTFIRGNSAFLHWFSLRRPQKYFDTNKFRVPVDRLSALLISLCYLLLIITKWQRRFRNKQNICRTPNKLYYFVVLLYGLVMQLMVFIYSYSDSLRAVRSGDRIPVGARFSSPVQTGPGVHPASYTMGTGSFPGVKRPRRGFDHPPPSSAEVEGRVELYTCSPSGPSWPVLWRTLPFTFCRRVVEEVVFLI